MLELDNQPPPSLTAVEPYVVSLYKGGRSTVEIGKMFGFSSESIRRFLKRRGVRMRTPSENARKHTINHQYFRHIRTSDQAYWLGFLLAAGHIIKKNEDSWLVVCPVRADRLHMLEKFSRAVSSSRPIYKYKNRNRVALSVNSTTWARSLLRLGWVEYRKGSKQELLDKIEPKLHEPIEQGYKAASEQR